MITRKLPWSERLRILFGGEPRFNKKRARLSRYTVHAIQCEICKKALQNGDLLFTFDLLLRREGHEDIKVGEHTPLAHAECLVHTTRPGTQIYWATDSKANGHPYQVMMPYEEWGELLKSAKD